MWLVPAEADGSDALQPATLSVAENHLDTHTVVYSGFGDFKAAKGLRRAPGD